MSACSAVLAQKYPRKTGSEEEGMKRNVKGSAFEATGISKGG